MGRNRCLGRKIKLPIMEGKKEIPRGDIATHANKHKKDVDREER